MKKRALAAVLVASMLMMTACSTSNGNTESEPSISETEAAASTDAITTDPTTDTTIPENQHGEEVVIPLFPEENREKIYQMDPIELLKFGNYAQLFNLRGSGIIEEATETSGAGGNELLTSDYYNQSYEISAPPSESGTTYVVTMYVTTESEFQLNATPEQAAYSLELTIAFYVNGTKVARSMANWIPLYYNETRKCFVGYLIDFNESTGETEGSRLVERYYNGNYWPVVDVADPSLYGF